MCYSPRLFIFLLDDKKIFKKFLAALFVARKALRLYNFAIEF